MQRNLGKLVVLKLGPGSFQQGFSVTLQIGLEGERPTLELPGLLPPVSDLPGLYQQWQMAYRQLRLPSRLEAQPDMVTNVSWVGDCHDSAERLCDRINTWLSHPIFQPISNKLLEQLSPTDIIRVVLQTEDPILRRLPWHQWDFFQRYPQAELALSAPFYQQVNAPQTLSQTVRILAILGDATGLDLETDRTLLQNLPGVDLSLLIGPDRATLNHYLWDQQGWDILFFAGHSGGNVGKISLNSQESLTISELKYALTKAVQQGLAIALFNSCDGLGLAEDLADLHIPQILVMREPIPDRVAHQFLKGFLESFSRNTPLYLSVREARERLQGVEGEFPCATWLPILCQNLAQQPPTWQGLLGTQQMGEAIDSVHRPWIAAVGLGVAMTAVTLSLRFLGGFQSLELAAYDRFLRWWPWFETPDARLVVIKNTEDDIKQQGLDRNSEFSITDDTLLAVLKKLELFQPRVIGIDIYHEHGLDPALPELKERLESMPNVVSLCKHPSDAAEMGGVAPPPQVRFGNKLGFSDFLEDTDSTTRRLLITIDRPPESPCPADYSFATLIAGQYLSLMGASDNLDDVFWQDTHDQFQLRQVRIPPLNRRSGGYKLASADGYQQLVRYRHLPNLEKIADTYDLSEVLSDDFEGIELRDRIVLLGTTSLSFGGGDIEERDFWKTPYTNSERLEDMTPGVFIQAHMVSQLVSAVEDGRPLISTWNEWIEICWITLWGIAGGAMGWRLSTGRLGLVLLTAEIGLLLVCWSLLALPALWVPYVPAAILMSGTAITVSRYRD
ncbi:CHASE2 domain-containing protein [Leptothoe spongobia]|uniref:CHASE2 domain-containing protein n=1 Tax=Leptothoe spongobia TAU-MAC 1115 TaxID=1967444 RepID=A0A947GJZ6_9CYAN|nr:CHASE2 domain-containing protein [Leptothoe spongobia]MBT9315867.1 CHASE2 domain-containing protein [Leptothoe spongobia TAU-MAC 1115]